MEPPAVITKLITVGKHTDLREHFDDVRRDPKLITSTSHDTMLNFIFNLFAKIHKHHYLRYGAEHALY